MADIKVSIILTSYNYGRYLKDTVNSVLNQTFADWELIIVGEGPQFDELQQMSAHS